MKITYDSEVDALYIRFHHAQVTSEHVAEGIAFDYDADGHLAGIEILDASKTFGDMTALRRLTFEELPVAGRRD